MPRDELTPQSLEDMPASAHERACRLWGNLLLPQEPQSLLLQNNAGTQELFDEASWPWDSPPLPQESPDIFCSQTKENPEVKLELFDEASIPLETLLQNNGRRNINESSLVLLFRTAYQGRQQILSMIRLPQIYKLHDYSRNIHIASHPKLSPVHALKDHYPRDHSIKSYKSPVHWVYSGTPQCGLPQMQTSITP